jgi:hypothetical protein
MALSCRRHVVAYRADGTVETFVCRREDFSGEHAGIIGSFRGTVFAACSRMLAEALTLKLPNSRTRSVWILALFAAVQVADAVMTLDAIERFGLAAEGNPVLLFYMSKFGLGVTLVGAKSLAIVLATALHLRAHHLTLAMLTLVYVVAAMAPWAWVLSTLTR